MAWPAFFPWIDDNHCDRIHSTLTTVHCFDNGYVGKQPWLGRILYGLLVKRTPEKYGQMHWPQWYSNWNTVENGVEHHTINQSKSCCLEKKLTKEDSNNQQPENVFFAFYIWSTLDCKGKHISGRWFKNFKTQGNFGQWGALWMGNISTGEYNTILSAYTLYRHLE